MIVRDKSTILDHLNQYKRSGLSKAEYCRKNKIKQSTFQTWYSKYEKNQHNQKVKNNLLDVSANHPKNIWQVFDLGSKEDLFEIKLTKDFHIEIHLNLRVKL